MLIKTIATMFPVTEYKIHLIDNRKYMLTVNKRLLSVRAGLWEIESMVNDIIKRCGYIT